MAPVTSFKKFVYLLICFAVFLTFCFFHLRSSSAPPELEHDIRTSNVISSSDFSSDPHHLSTNEIVVKDANLDSSLKSSASTADPKQSNSLQKTMRIKEDELASKYYSHDEKESKDRSWSAVRLESVQENSIRNARKILKAGDISETKSPQRQNLVLRPGMKKLAKDSKSFRPVPPMRTVSKILKKKPSRARRKMRHRPYNGPQTGHSHTLRGRWEAEKKKADRDHHKKKGNSKEKKVDLLGLFLQKTSAAQRHSRAEDLRANVAIRPRADSSAKSGRLHYELSTNWPQTCECKLARGLEKGMCYYYLDKSMKSCKRRLCGRSFLCVVGGEKTGTTCMRKKVTRRVISNGEGTCRTAVVDQYRYIPYSS